MRKDIFFVVPLVFLGVVDALHAWTPNHRGWADVELTDSSGKMVPSVIDTAFFPCHVKEGDMFYITIENGVTELRCGEPSPE
jgi:hypothetical protein